MFDWIVQHIIASIPLWVWTATAGGSIVLFAIAKLLGKINRLKIYTLLIKIISLIVFTVSVFLAGGSGVAKVWQEEIKAKQAEVDAATAKSKSANVKIKYVIRNQIKVIHDKQVVVQHDIARDAAVIDSECKVAPQAIKDLNEATQ